MLMRIRDIYEEETVMIVTECSVDEKWARKENGDVVDLSDVEVYDFDDGSWK